MKRQQKGKDEKTMTMPKKPILKQALTTDSNPLPRDVQRPTEHPYDKKRASTKSCLDHLPIAMYLRKKGDKKYSFPKEEISNLYRRSYGTEATLNYQNQNVHKQSTRQMIVLIAHTIG